MRIARLIGLAVGIMCLAGLGLASISRAQQAGRGVTQRIRQGRDGQDTLARLEAEVDSLSLEQEVARADLQDLLKRCSRLDRLREIGSLSAIGMTHEFLKEIVDEKVADGGIQKLADLASAGAPEEKNKEWKSMATSEVKRMFDSLHAFRDRKQKAFLEKSVELNKKKLELSDLREQSEREPK
jgi:hypothetical protein